MHRRWFALVLTVSFLVGCVRPPGAPAISPGAELGACPVFPADSFWQADVSALSTHASSTAWVAAVGAASHVHADFGSGQWNGGPIGIPFIEVGAGQPAVPISFDYADESDPGPYPIPSDAPIEGGPTSSGDRHVIVVDRSTCHLYETWDSHSMSTGWHAGSGATWDLRSNALRPAGWTSADAAGLAIFPGLVRYDEVAAGRIDHPIRFTAPRTQRSFIWPARHQAGSSTDPSLPPMGAWFRLRSDYDTSRLGPQARVVAEAMKIHGLILADNGSSWYLSGAPDPRWDNADLHTLDPIAGSDFVAVDTSAMSVGADSGQRR